MLAKHDIEASIICEENIPNQQKHERDEKQRGQMWRKPYSLQLLFLTLLSNFFQSAQWPNTTWDEVF